MIEVTNQPAAYESLVRLLKDGFTFHGAIVRSRGDGMKYIAVRGLMDSGSDAFLIVRQVIDRAAISEVELQPVAELEIRGLEGVKCRPKFQIELTWHMKRHANSRLSTFFVVDDASFDILVPSSLLCDGRGFDSASRAAYILYFRKKTAGMYRVSFQRHAEMIS